MVLQGLGRSLKTAVVVPGGGATLVPAAQYVVLGSLQYIIKMEKQKPVVAYYYDEESGNYCYTVNHPWRPHRSKLVHNLVTGYNLEKEMIVHRPRARTFEEITEFHADGKSRCRTCSGFCIVYRMASPCWSSVL